MKHFALLSLACAIWLVNRRRRNSSHGKVGTTEPLPLNTHPSICMIQHQRNHQSASAQVPAPDHAGLLITPAPNKSEVSAMLQWIFLILLGAALSLTASKGSWDVFSVLATAAILQLGGKVNTGGGVGPKVEGRQVHARAPQTCMGLLIYWPHGLHLGAG